MKTKNLTFLGAIFLAMLICAPLTAQDENAMPAYITVTTLYWSTDRESSDIEDENKWMEIEKKYLEEVTKKNEYIQSVGFYMHLYSASSLESKYVQTYASWADIEKAQDRNVELEKLAWPDEAVRKRYMNNRQSFYQDFHSDEIYVPLAGAKPFTQAPEDDMVAYIRISKMAFPEDGTNEEFMKLHKEFLEVSVHNNDKIKAYYPNVHGWGADRTEFIEAFYLESMDDLDDMNDGLSDAINAKWPDEAVRDEFFKDYNKYFTGDHGDYIYTMIAELRK
ncbi:MAG: hypothetical protein DWP94_01045 [Flavobacterium sp.]|nr:MAG: hypothetical protein DWP94_01045 [Flavobacterium sp.]